MNTLTAHPTSDHSSTQTSDQRAPERADATADGVWRRLDQDDTGAQAMEYAALAGGGCGIVGILIALLQSDSVQSRISNLLTSLFDQLGTSLSGLLGF